MDSGGWFVAGMIIGGYLLGSIPFGVVAAKCLGTVDPRTAGSRNIGSTNVLRLSGKTAGALTLAGDMGKGWLAGWGAFQIFQQEGAVLAVAFSVIVGHVWPVFLGFHGGKGVATALGAIGGVTPWIGLGMIGMWLVFAAIFRYSSGAAVVTFFSFPFLGGWLEQGNEFLIFSLLVSGLIMYRHKENIARLWNGTETRI